MAPTGPIPRRRGRPRRAASGPGPIPRRPVGSCRWRCRRCPVVVPIEPDVVIADCAVPLRRSLPSRFPTSSDTPSRLSPPRVGRRLAPSPRSSGRSTPTPGRPGSSGRGADRPPSARRRRRCRTGAGAPSRAGSVGEPVRVLERVSRAGAEQTAAVVAQQLDRLHRRCRSAGDHLLAPPSVPTMRKPSSSGHTPGASTSAPMTASGTSTRTRTHQVEPEAAEEARGLASARIRPGPRRSTPPGRELGHDQPYELAGVAHRHLARVGLPVGRRSRSWRRC